MLDKKTNYLSLALLLFCLVSFGAPAKRCGGEGPIPLVPVEAIDFYPIPLVPYSRARIETFVVLEKSRNILFQESLLDFLALYDLDTHIVTKVGKGTHWLSRVVNPEETQLLDYSAEYALNLQNFQWNKLKARTFSSDVDQDLERIPLYWNASGAYLAHYSPATQNVSLFNTQTFPFTLNPLCEISLQGMGDILLDPIQTYPWFLAHGVFFNKPSQKYYLSQFTVNANSCASLFSLQSWSENEFSPVKDVFTFAGQSKAIHFARPNPAGSDLLVMQTSAVGTTECFELSLPGEEIILVDYDLRLLGLWSKQNGTRLLNLNNREVITLARDSRRLLPSHVSVGKSKKWLYINLGAANDCTSQVYRFPLASFLNRDET